MKTKEYSNSNYSQASKSADEQYELGVRYVTGKGVARDYKKAAKIFEPLAQAGDERAQWELGRILCFPSDITGLQRDFKRAAKLFEQSAAKGHPGGQRDYGIMLYFGDGVKRDRKHAVELLEPLAQEGFDEAMYFAGLCYYHGGDGLARDMEKAIKYLEDAAKKGHPEAEEMLKEISKEEGEKKMFDNNDLQKLKKQNDKKLREKNAQEKKDNEERKKIERCNKALGYALSEIYNAGPEVAKIINDNGLKMPLTRKKGLFNVKAVELFEFVVNEDFTVPIGGGSVLHLLLAENGNCYGEWEYGRWGYGGHSYSKLFKAPDPYALTKNFISSTNRHKCRNSLEGMCFKLTEHVEGGNGGYSKYYSISEPYSKDRIKANVKDYLMNLISKLM